MRTKLSNIFFTIHRLALANELEPAGVDGEGSEGVGAGVEDGGHGGSGEDVQRDGERPGSSLQGQVTSFSSHRRTL